MQSNVQMKLKQQRDWIQKSWIGSVSFGWNMGLTENWWIYTCLDRAEMFIPQIKACGMQGRAAWTFSMLCHTYGIREEWLQAARSCLEFGKAHCMNAEKGNRMYFTVTADGKPLRQRRYNFSEGFFCMANAQYGQLTKQETYLQQAREMFEMIWKLNHGLMEDPVGLPPKTIPETRSGRTLANPMIYLNICAVMRDCDPANAVLYDERASICAGEILRYHHKPELKCTLENVGLDGEFERAITTGRIVNPGHTIECGWFLMEYALAHQNRQIFDSAAEMLRFALEIGWDKEYGGLLYFADCLGKPIETCEHDMKLWWPHTEIMIATLIAYVQTQDTSYYDWFTRTLDYCKQYFADETYGEWYGYLRRDGKPTMPQTKGTTYKGPFHLQRMLIKADALLGMLETK